MVNSLSGVDMCDARNEHTVMGGWQLTCCSFMLFLDALRVKTTKV
jgi:hypothetical protein